MENTYTILVLHGPNLNLLGERDPKFYGSFTLDEINRRLEMLGEDFGIKVRAIQANSEGALIDHLQQARHWARGVVFNPGGYSHSSISLRDAVSSINIPVVEVHLSNIQAREEFRRQSMVAPACLGSIYGFGWHSYALGLLALVRKFSEEDE